MRNYSLKLFILLLVVILTSLQVCAIPPRNTYPETEIKRFIDITEQILPAGTGLGQVLYWNTTANSWVATLSPADDDMLQWDATGSIWENTKTPSGLTSLEVTGTITAGDVLVSSLTASTGVYTDVSKQLTSTAPTTGILGYWTRTGTTLSMVNTTDLVSLGGNIDLNDTFIENAGYVQFDIDFANGSAEGRLQWNSIDGTLEVGMPGGNVNLQIGQEMLIRVTNDAGIQIDNGTPVYISGATGTNIKVDIADADFAGAIGQRTVGVATEDITAGQKGFVTTQGFVRDIDTTFAAVAGLPAYLASGGGFTTVAPAAPDTTYLVGIVTIANHATNGEIYVIQRSIPNLNSLSDVDTSGIVDNDILRWDSAANVYKDTTPTVDIPIVLTSYISQPARASENNIHGAFLSLATGQPLNPTPTDIVVTKGIGKLIIVVNAGSDLVGDITITGTSVNRDTGATSPADTDTITIDALTTDGSTADSNGNIIHDFTDAYISSKWFTGTVTLSTVDVTLTDVDVWHVSFEQFNDRPSITLNTFDVNLQTTNVNAEFDAYLFDLHTSTGDKCNIENQAALHVGADGETAIAAKYWRLRRGGINQPLDGTTDGIWVDIHVDNPAYVEDLTIKVWATSSQPLTLN